MPDTEENIDYFDYWGYIKGKNEDKRLYSYPDQEMERYRTIMKEIQVREQLPKFKDIFIRVHRLLGNTYPFYHAFNVVYCKYVNYVLNKIISPLYNEEEKLEYVSLFDKFGTKLRGIQGSTSNCLPDLHYIKPEIFTRINSLYDLYDKYNDLLEAKKSKGVFPCNELTIFRVFYNDNIRTYDGKENKLIEKLIQLKKLIGQNIFSTNTKICGEHVTHFNEPVKYLEEKEKEKKRLALLEEENLREQQQQLQQQQKQDKEIEQFEHNPTQAEEETESGEQLLSPKPQEVQRIPLGTEQSHIDLNTVLPELPKYSGKSMVARNPYKQEMEENEIDKYDTGYPTRGKNEESDYFGKVQGFFTETFRHVEPAPILGVSGGMGALFLLFKYTPVGSFFGRRRGLNHRIPGGFPGAYPGFPEYFDGNLGNMPINISYQAE